MELPLPIPYNNFLPWFQPITGGRELCHLQVVSLLAHQHGQRRGSQSGDASRQQPGDVHEGAESCLVLCHLEWRQHPLDASDHERRRSPGHWKGRWAHLELWEFWRSERVMRCCSRKISLLEKGPVCLRADLWVEHTAQFFIYSVCGWQ